MSRPLSISMNSSESIVRKAFTYKSSLEAYAFSIIHDWGLAEDAVQEALIKVSSHTTELDEKGLLSWMKKVTYNKVVDIVRRRKRNVYNSELLESVNRAFEKQLDEKVVKKAGWQHDALDYCLRKIDVKQKKLILAFYLEGKRTEELAREYGRPDSSIRVQLHRLRESLRKCTSKVRRLS